MTTVDPVTDVGGVTYRVTPEYLTNAATSTDKTAADIDGLLDGVRSYVVSLEASWQGIAADQFQIMMSTYDTYAKQLNDALNGIANGLRGTYLNYTENEQQSLNNLHAVELPPPANFT